MSVGDCLKNRMCYGCGLRMKMQHSWFVEECWAYVNTMSDTHVNFWICGCCVVELTEPASVQKSEQS